MKYAIEKNSYVLTKAILICDRSAINSKLGSSQSAAYFALLRRNYKSYEAMISSLNYLEKAKNLIINVVNELKLKNEYDLLVKTLKAYDFEEKIMRRLVGRFESEKDGREFAAILKNKSR